jgi:hypothetical protein
MTASSASPDAELVARLRSTGDLPQQAAFRKIRRTG